MGEFGNGSRGEGMGGGSGGIGFRGGYENTGEGLYGLSNKIGQGKAEIIENIPY